MFQTKLTLFHSRLYFSEFGCFFKYNFYCNEPEFTDEQLQQIDADRGGERIHILEIHYNILQFLNNFLDSLWQTAVAVY